MFHVTLDRNEEQKAKYTDIAQIGLKDTMQTPKSTNTAGA